MGDQGGQPLKEQMEERNVRKGWHRDQDQRAGEGWELREELASTIAVSMSRVWKSHADNLHNRMKGHHSAELYSQTWSRQHIFIFSSSLSE